MDQENTLNYIPGTDIVKPKEVEYSEDVYLHKSQRYTEVQKMILSYECAVKELLTKLEILNAEMALNTKHNPIKFMKSRVKSWDSILAKAERYGVPADLESIQEHIHDIGGVRVIVRYIDEIYFLAEMLAIQEDVTFVSVKDYISDPKGNGYRSLHMVVSLPVYFSNEKRNIKVEIQIRTVAMDFWASLEHHLRYKNEIDIPDEVHDELKEAAITIHDTDIKMMKLRQKIQDLALIKDVESLED